MLIRVGAKGAKGDDGCWGCWCSGVLRVRVLRVRVLRVRVLGVRVLGVRVMLAAARPAAAADGHTAWCPAESMIWTREPTDLEAFRGHWESIRRGGRRRYIVLHGVVGWAWPTALLYTVITQMIGSPGAFLGRLGIALLMFSVGGIAFGLSMWSRGGAAISGEALR